MIQEIYPHYLNNQYHASEPKPDDYVIAFCGSGRKDDSVLAYWEDESKMIWFPTVGEFADGLDYLYLFSTDAGDFYLLRTSLRAKAPEDIMNLVVRKEKKLVEKQIASRQVEEENFEIQNETELEAVVYDSSRGTLMVEDESLAKEDTIEITPQIANKMELDVRPIVHFRRYEPMDICFAGITAYHLFSWYRNHQYCGHCGSRMQQDAKERMMRCPVCGVLEFPKIAPAVIVAVRDGERIVMSRYAGREYKGNALIAGFCEIGETPEQTVAREVYEEVGLRVKNIQYYKSQPWGFDSDLLLGFVCDLDGSDEIRIDAEELASARWVSREEIEQSTNLRSLTATMIEAFRTGAI